MQDELSKAVAILQNHPGIQNQIGTRVQDALIKWLFEI